MAYIATYSSNSRIDENQNPIYAKIKFYRRAKKLFSDWITKLYRKHFHFLKASQYHGWCKNIFNLEILKIKKNGFFMGFWFLLFFKCMYTVFWFSLYMGFWFDFFRKLHQYHDILIVINVVLAVLKRLCLNKFER